MAPDEAIPGLLARCRWRLIADMARRERRERHPPARSTERPPPPRRQTRREAPVEPRRDGGTWISGRHAVRAVLNNPARRLRRMVATSELAAEARTWLEQAKARTFGELE